MREAGRIGQRKVTKQVPPAQEGKREDNVMLACSKGAPEKQEKNKQTGTKKWGNGVGKKKKGKSGRRKTQMLQNSSRQKREAEVFWPLTRRSPGQEEKKLNASTDQVVGERKGSGYRKLVF